jgi:hypothetical protein
MFTKRITGIWICSTLILIAASRSDAAMVKPRVYGYNNPAANTLGSYVWATSQYIDFSSSSTSGNRQWDTFGKGEKISYFQILGAKGSGNQCYEVTTSRGDAETANADTRFFVKDYLLTQAWKFVNDDYNGTDYSRMRVWAVAEVPVNFLVTPFSNAQNGIDFYLNIVNLRYSTEASCKGNGIAFVTATINSIKIQP